MKLIFLGTTGYHPNNLRHTSCLMLPEPGIILDAGTGIFRARDLIQTEELHIFMTHAHLDHSLGLTFIFDIIHERNVKKVFVHGEAPKLEVIQEHLFSPLLFPVKPPLTFVPFKADQTVIGEYRIRHFQLEHPGGSVGFRIENGDSSLAYVTDTTASLEAAYVDEIRDVDLLVHECYFPDGFEQRAELTGHSCTGNVAQVARAANVGKLMLVHVNPLDETDDPIGIDSAREIFPDSSLASDLQEVDV